MFSFRDICEQLLHMLQPNTSSTNNGPRKVLDAPIHLASMSAPTETDDLKSIWLQTRDDTLVIFIFIAIWTDRKFCYYLIFLKIISILHCSQIRDVYFQNSNQNVLYLKKTLRYIRHNGQPNCFKQFLLGNLGYTVELMCYAYRLSLLSLMCIICFKVSFLSYNWKARLLSVG